MADTYVGILAVNSVDYVEHVFACYQAGKIVVPLFDASNALPPQITLEDTIEPDASGGWFKPNLPDNRSDDIAQISFSSGTEGTPKGIALSHRALLDVAERLCEHMRLDDSVREYVGIPVYYSFGLARCRSIARVGGSAYVPANGFSLAEFANMLEAGEVNALSAVPTLLRIVIAKEDRFLTIGRDLKWLEIGSQYISRAEKEALKRIFPNAVILLNYGLTEASRATLQIVSDTSGDALESVGRAEGHIEVEIDTQSRIRLKGPNLASYILKDGEVMDLADPDGWFTTSDVGYIEDGNLYFGGRADDIINISAIKLSAEVLEQKLAAQLDDGLQIAIIGVPDPVRGERILVVAENAAPDDIKTIQSTAEATFGEINPAVGSAVSVTSRKRLPRTQTQKVQRNALRNEYRDFAADERSKTSANTRTEPSSRGDMFEDVLAIVRYQFPNLEIAPDACIEELGGTSLDFVELELAMESVLGHLPNDWHRTQLSKLASDAEANKVGAKRATRFDQLSARSLCCILVVFVHVVGYEIGAGLQLPRDHWLHSFNELAEYFKMPLFAFAAGLTFSMQGAASKDPSTFLGSTIKSLILPMVGTMMVFYGLSTAIGSDAGAPHTAWWYPLINSYAHFWFIQSLILILIGSYAVTRYAPGLNTTYGLLLICAPLIAVPYFQTSFLSIAGIGVLAPFFALGFLFDAPKGRTKICVDGIVQNIWYLATAAIAAALIAYFGFDKLYLMPHFAAFLIGLPIVVLVLLYASLIPGLKRLAPYTFYIFLWHVFATSPMRRILYSIGIEDTFTHIVFGMAVGLGVPILAVIVMKRLGVFRFVEGRW